MATSDFVPALGVGDPRECRGYVAIPPIVGPGEGTSEGTTFDFPRGWRWGPPRMQGLGSNSAPFWAPEKARVRWTLLISFPHLALGTPENAGVT